MVKNLNCYGIKTIEAWNDVQDNKDQLLTEGEQIFLEVNFFNWKVAKPYNSSGIYGVKKDNQLIYIGETTNILERYTTHSSVSYFSALRRHIGTEFLNCSFINDKKRNFTSDDDCKIDNFLTKCQYGALNVSFGRFELEEHLIKKYQPFLNRKSKIKNQLV